MTTGVPGTGAFEARLPPQPSSVADARRKVRDLLVDGGREDLVETAELLVSEVVTNAMLHAGTDIELAGRLDELGLKVEVGDGSPHLPSRRRYAATAGTGRGLLMLESLVDDWGVDRHPHGKTIWFVLSQGDPEEHLAELRSPGGSRSRSAGVPVELRNMPLLLHAAWQEHAEALLREYLLVNLDSEGQDTIQMHAEATDAIAVLEEHLPSPDVRITPDELMSDATEPKVTSPRLEVSVPVESVEHFETLDRAIEAALDLSREGLVLTPPTQPEIQAFRRWLCRQVLRQAAGGSPEPWVVPDVDRAEPSEPLDWDPDVVASVVDGRIAADQTSRILGVSAEAARILGYDDAADLVGARIVSIIPERYRQAHVAGFTMYLLVGRQPLLDRPVVVPALRRDGSEVLVELTVREEGLHQGASVLVAGIRAVRER